MEDYFQPRENGGCAIELQEGGLDGSRRNEPAKAAQLPKSLCGPDRRSAALRHVPERCLGLEGICRGIGAAQRASQGDPPCGRPNKRRLHQREWTATSARAGKSTSSSTSLRIGWQPTTGCGPARTGTTPKNGTGWSGPVGYGSTT